MRSLSMYVIGYCGDGDGGGCGQVWFSDSRYVRERIAAVRLDPPGTVRWGVRRVALARFSFVAGLVQCVFIRCEAFLSQLACLHLKTPCHTTSHANPSRIGRLTHRRLPPYLQSLLRNQSPVYTSSILRLHTRSQMMTSPDLT